MSYAYDFSAVPGPPAEVIAANDGQGALVYGTGPQQSPAYIAGLRSVGLHVPLIWEHNVDSILGGFDYGADECRAWQASHPPGLVYLACDLNDGALAGRSVVPFCAGWCSVSTEDAVGLYGPDDAILQGQAAGLAKLSRWWGVVNWLRGGYPDNDPRNIVRWTEIGAHLVQLIGSPIPNTDQNLILRDDWWTTGGAPAQPKDEDVDFYATDPGTRAQIWRFGTAGRRWLTPSEWQIVQTDAVLNSRPAPKPYAGTPEMFDRTPDVTTYVGGGSGSSSSAPTRFNIAATTATAA